MFCIRLNIAESKRTELAISTTKSTTKSTTESSGKRIGTTAKKIVDLMWIIPKFDKRINRIICA